jgi:hypothetical protein
VDLAGAGLCEQAAGDCGRDVDVWGRQGAEFGRQYRFGGVERGRQGVQDQGAGEYGGGTILLRLRVNGEDTARDQRLIHSLHTSAERLIKT